EKEFSSHPDTRPGAAPSDNAAAPAASEPPPATPRDRAPTLRAKLPGSRAPAPPEVHISCSRRTAPASAPRFLGAPLATPCEPVGPPESGTPPLFGFPTDPFR